MSWCVVHPAGLAFCCRSRLTLNVRHHWNHFPTAAMKKPLPVEPKVVKKMRPGSPGTLKHVRQWGDALVCVRHRHDTTSRVRFTTIEIVVEQMPIQLHTKTHVAVGLDPHDKETRSLMLAAGGRWNQSRRVWQVPREIAAALGLVPEVSSAVGPKD